MVCFETPWVTILLASICNLGSASSVLAELWGLTHDLRMASSRGVQRLVVEVDSKIVTALLFARSTHCAHLQPVLEEALALIHDQQWNCSVHHIFREANQCADILAGLGHHGGFQVSILERAPNEINLALMADARGCFFVRLVR